MVGPFVARGRWNFHRATRAADRHRLLSAAEHARPTPGRTQLPLMRPGGLCGRSGGFLTTRALARASTTEAALAADSPVWGEQGGGRTTKVATYLS